MAVIRVPRDYFDRPDVPMVCVVTGGSTVSKGLFVQHPRDQGRVPWLLRWSVVGLIATAVIERDAEYRLNLPVCRDAWDRIKVLRFRTSYLLGAAFFLVVLALLAAIASFVLGGVLAVFAAGVLIGWSRARRELLSVYPAATDDEHRLGWITVSPVHAGFAAAVGATQSDQADPATP